MSSSADTSTKTDVNYELAHQPDDTSYVVRENLVDILERELLGPIHGPNEVLPFSPRSQYLVGLIAPVKLNGGRPSPGHDEGVDSERGHLIEAYGDGEGGRGVPASAADETEAEAEGEESESESESESNAEKWMGGSVPSMRIDG